MFAGGIPEPDLQKSPLAKEEIFMRCFF